MDTITKKKIQKEVISLLTSSGKKSLYILSKDCCSEMSRLVGYRIMDSNPKTETLIIKGVLTNNKQHDILVVKEGDLFSLIDPTIWQFYKNKKTIFLGTFKDVTGIFKFTEKFYGGKWSLSENLKRSDSKKEQEKCLSVLMKNLNSIEIKNYE
jgi:hypothetical protein